MKKVLFIDRDGTIVREPEDHQLDSFDKLAFLPGVIKALARISQEDEFSLVMVTNQDGLGTDSFPEADFFPIQNFILATLAGEGIVFDEVLVDRSLESENAPTRKPRTGMLGKYFSNEFDLANSFVIGDRLTDVQLARNLGTKAIFIGGAAPDEEADRSSVFTVGNWNEICDIVLCRNRTVIHRRETSETDFTVELNLDGSGKAEINTGIAFFDHMLDQLARHGGIDLRIQGKGDLQIDEHHTIEDVAITLGEAFSIALGDKRGLERYGFCLPMDDCLAQVAIDFGGRNCIVWDADFKREMIGKMPTEMFIHFFKSFSDHAKCNLNIKAEGTIEHHKIEAIFKAFARSIKMAVRRSGTGVPSTKGVL